MSKSKGNTKEHYQQVRQQLDRDRSALLKQGVTIGKSTGSEGKYYSVGSSAFDREYDAVQYAKEKYLK